MALCLIKYFGGKNKLCNWIIPQLGTHNTYLEPFGGAGNILINKSESNIEIYNEISTPIYLLFNQVKYNLPQLKEVLSTIKNNKQTFLNYKESNPINDFEIAVKEWVVRKLSFSGCGQTYAANPQSEITNAIIKLDVISNRLKNVLLFNKNAFDLIPEYTNNKNALIYIDPPYVHSKRNNNSIKVYDTEMNDYEHIKLIELIRYAKAKIVLSGYDNDVYQSLGWRYVKKSTKINSSTLKIKPTKNEFLWFNY